MTKLPTLEEFLKKLKDNPTVRKALKKCYLALMKEIKKRRQASNLEKERAVVEKKSKKSLRKRKKQIEKKLEAAKKLVKKSQKILDEVDKYIAKKAK